MKRTGIVLLILLTALLFTGCASPGPTPQEVYEAFTAAMDAGDLDEAMTHIADDARFKVPVGTLKGTDQIRPFLQDSIDQAAAVKSENIVVTGNVLTSDVELDFGAFQVAGVLTVTVEGGLITDYDFTMNQ